LHRHPLRARRLMRFSLGLPTHRVDAGDEFVSGAAVARLAAAAEAAGFSSVFVTDHPAPPRRWVSGGGHVTTDPLVTLAFAAGAKHLHTPGLESYDDLHVRIGYLREQCTAAGRTEPVDIAFMPSGLDMFARAAPDPAKVRDDVAELAALGVTWATVTLPGQTRADLLRAIDGFGADVISALA